MELTSLLGIIFAIAVLIGGMTVAHIEISMLLNVEALVVIIGGTIAAITNAFPGKKLKMVPKLFKVLFTSSKGKSESEIIQLFTELSSVARKQGMLALEPKMEEVDDLFIKRAIELIITGQGDEKYIREMLEEEIGNMEERHEIGAKVFMQAGTYAPTLGVMGAVLGLIHSLGNLDDVEQLGHSIASAFVATLMGIFTGYVLWHPFANKLKIKSAIEVHQKLLIVEGVIALHQGLAPRIVQQKMLVFLSETEREKFEKTIAEGED